MSANERRARRRPGAPIALAVAVGLVVVTSVVGVVASPPAAADGCGTWTRTLRNGSAGTDVHRLQIRLSGYPGYGSRLSIDGVYGPATAAAVWRFQVAYGLTADGIAGPQTFRVIDRLQDDDCTPAHFSYGELDDGCGWGGWGGGPVAASTARTNALITMWKLEALRHALGDQPLRIASGFRSIACNRRVGGASRSRHLYGDAADIDPGPHGLCTVARRARHHGFDGIYGPGYPNHDGHVHVDSYGISWRAPRCGI
ncbi:MAG: peptidase M15 [Acidimicrobiales bacterium]|nr:peptidase M15 [Acidimicrobiales bacterium]